MQIDALILLFSTFDTLSSYFFLKSVVSFVILHRLNCLLWNTPHQLYFFTLSVSPAVCLCFPRLWDLGHFNNIFFFNINFIGKLEMIFGLYTLCGTYLLHVLSVPQGTLVCVWESFRLRRLRRLRILFSL